jgi:hypothetical protein
MKKTDSALRPGTRSRTNGAPARTTTISSKSAFIAIIPRMLPVSFSRPGFVLLRVLAPSLCDDRKVPARGRTGARSRRTREERDLERGPSFEDAGWEEAAGGGAAGVMPPELEEVAARSMVPTSTEQLEDVAATTCGCCSVCLPTLLLSSCSIRSSLPSPDSRKMYGLDISIDISRSLALVVWLERCMA